LPKKKDKVATAGKSLLQQLAGMPEKLFSRAFEIQIGALCYRKSNDRDLEILLVTSRGTGRWIIPKGWPMNKKKPHEAALIEAFEEAGVVGRVGKKPVGRYTYLKWLDTGRVAPCVVDVFQIEVTKTAQKYKETGQRKVAWFSRDEAARLVREVELKSLIVNFRPED
jgi:8-oxo-dGTP pyrophosphatase MutT (NUDIX family)